MNMNLIQTFLFVLWVHYIVDFPLQGEFLGVYKSKYDYLLFVHSFIWAGGVILALSYCGLFAWWKLVMLFAGHAYVDRWKARHEDKNEHGLGWLLWTDQFLHAAQCWFCVAL